MVDDIHLKSYIQQEQSIPDKSKINVQLILCILLVVILYSGGIIILITAIFQFPSLKSNQQTVNNSHQILAAPKKLLTVCASENPECDFYGNIGLNQAVTSIPENRSKVTILIRSGTYKLSTNIVIHNKNLKILGEGITSTNISGENLSNLSVFKITGSSIVEISNIKISNGGGSDTQKDIVYSGIVGFNNSDINIVDTEVTQSKGWGVTYGDQSHGTIRHSLIHDCSLTGVRVDDNANITMSTTKVYFNEENGVYLSAFSDSELKNNLIYDNQQYGIDIYSRPQQHIKLFNNVVYGNGSSGLRMYNTKESYVLIVNSVFAKNMRMGIEYVRDGKDNINKNLSVSNNLFWENNHGCVFSLVYCTAENSINLTRHKQDRIFVNENEKDFHLTNNSIAKHAGNARIMNPDGTKSDIGAYGDPDACEWKENMSGCK